LLSKLEEWINKYLLLLGQIPFRLYDRFVPVKIKVKISNIFCNIRTRPREYAKNLFHAIKNLPTTIKQNQGALIHLCHVCLDATRNAVNSIQKLDVEKLRNGKWRVRFAEICTTLTARLRQTYRETSPKTLLLLVFILTTGSLAVFQIYKTSIWIYKRNFPQAFVPEPIVQGARRPAYHNLMKKSFYVTNISIPFGFEGSTVDKEAEGIKSLIIDIEVEASNRYLSIYLSTQEHLIKDYLNKKLEPVLPTFPLTPEGKRVMRDKIIEELNKLIPETGAKGTIENVFIINITVS